MPFVAWGTADEVIPPSTQDKYVNLLCTSGESLVYRSYPDTTHVGVLAGDSALPADLEDWTNQRSPAANGCPP
jgi:hypothetical protein